MAVGVGKTYRMLQDGHAAIAEGRDVAIGLLETHGRPDTAAMAEGLELIPRRRVAHAGTCFEEMDLPAITRRRPRICLIDELAHTNVPGLEHDKRFEDVEDVLQAGIDVFSTVNVQHLQSVAGRVEDATGISVSERLPDRVIDDADEVVVVDVTPEALQARIVAGKVFPASSTPVALERFFTKANLDVLRELALVQIVEEVEAHRLAAEMLDDDDRLISSVPAERRLHFLGLVKPDPSANRITRRAWEMSERLGGGLDLLTVAGGEHDGEGEQRIADLHRLAAVFGARLIVESDRDLARAVLRVAERQGTTHIVMGVPHPSRRFGRPASSLVDEIAVGAPSMHVALIGDPPASRGQRESTRPGLS